MQENTNKAIVLNSLILYVRLGINTVTGLLTTRFALQALGNDDFGLFSVVGGIISFIAVFNTIMSGTSNRFIATAIGKGSIEEANKTFNVNLVVHCIIALIILIIAFPIGDWYILHFVNYSGPISSVSWVFRITVLGSVISFIGVPYNGLLLAKERFFVFSAVDALSHIVKMIVAYVLISHFTSKLFIYALTISILSAYPTIVYARYCHGKFKEITHIKFVKDWNQYKTVLSFSVWVGYGAVATIGKTQGAALLVNAFFSTIMNTALGIANTVNGVLMLFGSNVTKSISPQITKSYASGNIDRSESLVVLASKVSFLLLLFVSVPFLVAPSAIFRLWLGEIPQYVITFTYLIIIDSLIGSLNAGIPDLIFASGNIKWYQIIVNTFTLLSILVGFFVLKNGSPAYYLQIVYIIFSAIVLVLRQIILNKVVKVNNWKLIRNSYIPALSVAALFALFACLFRCPSPLLTILISYIFLSLLIFFIGLSNKERAYIIKTISAKF